MLIGGSNAENYKGVGGGWQRGKRGRDRRVVVSEQAGRNVRPDLKIAPKPEARARKASSKENMMHP